MFSFLKKDKKMTAEEFQEACKRTAVLEGPHSLLLPHFALGIAGESGEVVDLIKKHIYQGHELNIEGIKGEIGDVLWYIANICNLLNINLGDVFRFNQEKLLRRYPGGFSTKKSIYRK